EEYARFPRLYHLDDYSTCLAKTDGLYCLGSFHIQQPKQFDPTYELLREYSADPFHFNRTQVHRGYCVSDRCPSTERNTSLRFEQCAAQWGRKRKLRLALNSLKYCKTHAQEYARKENPEPYDLSQKVLLTVVAVLCFANAVGTIYDVFSGDGAKKRELLAVWSLRENWRRLTASYEEGNPRLNAILPVQGVRVTLTGPQVGEKFGIRSIGPGPLILLCSRVLLMMLVIGTHGGCIHDMLYLQNPQFVEKVGSPDLAFLLAYNLLLLSKTRELTSSMLLYCLVKRIARERAAGSVVSPRELAAADRQLRRRQPSPQRNLTCPGMWSLRGNWRRLTASYDDGNPRLNAILPVQGVRIMPLYLLVLGFAATFWPSMRAGPMWPTLVEAESRICRDKFWTHVFLATDMQLYILATLLTIWLAKKRAGATLHTMYRGVASFYRFYTTPWGSLPACLVGLFLAHLHFELEERCIKPNSYRIFRWAYSLAPILMVCWIVAGNWVRDITNPGFTATYAGLERPVLSILAATILLGLFNGMTGFYQNWFSWSGWHAMGRMSLSVLMIHWLINTCIAASRPQPISTSLLDVVSTPYHDSGTVDSVATAAMSYIASIPLTLMVEMPMLRSTE
ncbi:Uncharacterized protein OBRU01_21041, partial [Operophtera brumata]